MAVCAAFWVAVVKIVFRSPPFVIDSIFEPCLRYFFGFDMGQIDQQIMYPQGGALRSLVSHAVPEGLM